MSLNLNFLELSPIIFKNSTYLNFQPQRTLTNSFINNLYASFIKFINYKYFKTTNEMDPNCPRLGEKCRMRKDGTPASVAPGPATEMDSKPFLTCESAWQKLQQYYDQTGKNIAIKDLFCTDADRFKKYRLVVSIKSLCFPSALYDLNMTLVCFPKMTNYFSEIMNENILIYIDLLHRNLF